MEQYLIDYARTRGRLKRGGDRKRVSLTIAEGELKNIETVDGDSLEELLKALKKLENVMPRAAEVVRLRYISGHTIKQTAVALDISERTVVDDWEYARAYLRREMSKDNQ
jgi:RNA polymerase sigma factor (sigma-70 family)